jgi:hypothetical protein
MMLLHTPPFGNYPPEFSVPKSVVQHAICPQSGKMATENCARTIHEWFLEEQVPKDYCTIHQRYIVKREDGTAMEEVYEVFPPQYSAWSREHHIPEPPEGSTRVYERSRSSPHAARDDSFQLAITSPNNGDFFKIDPLLRREYQMIRITGMVPHSLSDVRFRVDDRDGREYATKGVWWQLQKGIHRFQLVGKQGARSVTSEPITILVE